MKTLTFHMITVIKPSQGRFDGNKQISRKNATVGKQGLWQGSQTRGLHVACGPGEHFVRPAMLFGNFTFRLFSLFTCVPASQQVHFK